MPEGPTIVILKEEAALFRGKKILDVSGKSKIDQKALLNQKITDFRTWGKHFLIYAGKNYIRVHFLLFGSYRINEVRAAAPTLHLKFSNGELNFYASAIKMLESHPDEVYDWSADVMNDAWDPKAARKKLQQKPEMLVCDALLSQDIFSGVGNIIKNEVLFRIRVHPMSQVGNLPPAKLTAMIKEARIYSFQFYEWKKAFELKKHWLAHTRKTCPRCLLPFEKAYLGKTKRRAFFCPNCQKLY